MRQGQNATLAEHDVEVELLAQSLPQLQRMLVDRRRFVPEIVGAADGGVAAGVAAADPALLQHRDVAAAVHRRRSEEHTSELQSRMRSSYPVSSFKNNKSPSIIPSAYI